METYPSAAAGADAAPPALRLYGSPISDNTYKPALMLALCGQRFEFVPIDVEGGATRTDAYRAINRFQEIPVLEQGAQRIVQSGVILTYLAEQLGRFGHLNEVERWRIQEWLAWDNHRMTTGPALLHHQIRFVAGTDPAVLVFLRGRAERALGLLSAGLAKTGWLVGNRPTIADIATCASAFSLDEAGLDATRWPAIPAWLDRIRALPGFAPSGTLMKV